MELDIIVNLIVCVCTFNMKKIWNEIKCVGFIHWCWFVFYINRNEFHPNLNKYDPLNTVDVMWITAKRNRAHLIDEILSELKHD